jgi:hypothetical protein
VLCLSTKAVGFDTTGLSRLLNLSLSKKYAPMVRPGLPPYHQWRASRVGEEGDPICTRKANGGGSALRHEVCAGSHLSDLCPYPAEKTDDFHHRQDIQHMYTASVRRRSLIKHPPSMILAAIVASQVFLKHIIMKDRPWGDSHGIKPRVLDNLKLSAGCFQDLTSIRLLLTIHSCKFPHTRTSVETKANNAKSDQVQVKDCVYS